MEETDKLIDNNENNINNEKEEEIIDDAKDQIFHNPIENYAINNKFPYLLFLQLFIIIFTMYRLINNSKENELGRYFKHFVYDHRGRRIALVHHDTVLSTNRIFDLICFFLTVDVFVFESKSVSLNSHVSSFGIKHSQNPVYSFCPIIQIALPSSTNARQI